MEGQSHGHLLASNFLQALFGGSSEGYITLWNSETKKTHWHEVNNIDSVVKDAMTLRKHCNVYFGLGLRKEKLEEYKRGTSEDILALTCAWIEIDIKGGIHAADNLPTISEAYELLKMFSLKPSIINHSGGGLHCYWLLDQPASINNEVDMNSARRMVARFQSAFIHLARTKGFHIDNTADLARVLRVPGTFNLKTDPKPVEILTFKPNRSYSLSQLLEAIKTIEVQFPEKQIKEARRELSSGTSNVSDSNKIIGGCQFIKDYLDNKESASYDKWLAALSIASYCKDAENLVHEWSKGHKGYSEQETDRKYHEIITKMKPRTCQSIHRDFGKCLGCQHFNNINSPISLGMNKGEGTQKKRETFNRTDLGNSERLIYHYGENIKYNNLLGKWLLWNGKVWVEDKKNEIQQLAKMTVRKIYQEAYQETDLDKRKYLTEHAKGSEARARIGAMISLAKSEVPVLPDEMDKSLWLFNCQNGVIDLKTGDLKPHNRDYMMTKISPIAYYPNAECPAWLNFLEDIMQDDEGNVKHELINFLQKMVGYTLTGDTSEQVLFFLYGNGKNGKSTLVNVIKEVHGDYGKQTNTDTFTVRKSERVNNDIAALKGARMVAATESEEGGKLAESLVKQLTGGEPIQARFLHQEFFEYIPQFKIIFTTNHKPVIRGADDGIWRRIRLVPFTVQIPDEKVDKNLPGKLRKEMSGILRWAVEGCLKWQKEGLEIPQEVEEATASYRDEMDTMGNFLHEYCTNHSNAKCIVSDLYKNYTKWCEENGEYELSKQHFNRKIEERGYKKKRSTGGHYYFFGIGIQELPLVRDLPPTSEKVKFSEVEKSDFNKSKTSFKEYGANTSPKFTSSLDAENVISELI